MMGKEELLGGGGGAGGDGGVLLNLCIDVVAKYYFLNM